MEKSWPGLMGWDEGKYKEKIQCGLKGTRTPGQFVFVFLWSLLYRPLDY